MSAFRDRNSRLAWTMVAVVGGMLGLAYAAVPLYQAFCKATGFGGTPLIAQSGDRPVIARTVTVRFDSNVDPNLPWRFEPVQPEGPWPNAEAVIEDSLTLQLRHLNPTAGAFLERCADGFAKVWDNLDVVAQMARA